MKAELRMAVCPLSKDDLDVEVWHGDQFVGCICPADGPGFRFMTTHKATMNRMSVAVNADGISIVEVLARELS
jgi:hypothetical protein